MTEALSDADNPCWAMLGSDLCFRNFNHPGEHETYWGDVPVFWEDGQEGAWPDRRVSAKVFRAVPVLGESTTTETEAEK